MHEYLEPLLKDHSKLRVISCVCIYICIYVYTLSAHNHAHYMF